MSGFSDTQPCPICGQRMDVYTDYKPFDTVSMRCVHCGFNGHVTCGMECEEARKASFLDQGLDEADFTPLTKKQRRQYLAEFKRICGDVLSAADEALYLGRPYKSTNKVIVVVRGGIAEVLSCPPSVEVEIRDFDMDSRDPLIITQYDQSGIMLGAPR